MSKAAKATQGTKSGVAKSARSGASRNFWQKEWFVGLVVLIGLFALNRSTDLIDSLDRKAYDWGVQTASHKPNDRIAIIAIDDDSIGKIGRWPWSREVHAQLIDLLATAKPKLIAHTSFFFEPQRDAGLVYVNRLNEQYSKYSSSIPSENQVSELQQIGQILKEADDKLNTDRTLATSIKNAGNVLLPLALNWGEPRGNPDKPLPAFISRFTLQDPNGSALPSDGIQFPLAELAQNMQGTGHLSMLPDIDGAIRGEALLATHYSQFVPAFSLMVAAQSLNLGVQDMKVQWGENLRMGKLNVATDNDMVMHSHFYNLQDGKPPFSVDSFYDVLNGKIPVSKYADKIVLIGATATGLGTHFPTPVSRAMSPVEILAHDISSILSQHFYVVPAWMSLIEILVTLLIATYVMIALPRLSARAAALCTSGLLIALLALHFGLMLGTSMWMQLMFPATLLVIGHLALTTKRFLITEAGKIKSDADSAESNRMLALAFQGQGQLDMAWDKFRKCPLEEGLLDNLYNLALDFERKRQFNKAQAVYEYMAAYNPDFRDLPQKLNRAKSMAETIILGGTTGGRTNSANLISENGAVEKPMLGRYLVEKELGKGAMGVVYLGKDPKISRVVAIKTMALAQEFDEEELVEVKERFFREAETAGRLNHPNIVTIYDAGEEHDLCYISMEFLRGKDLVAQTKPDQLLPVATVLKLVAQVAEALGYAHTQHVVHRDIKPANMMYDPAAEAVKVTDFGIARITDSSKTKTGMVLGTPSYMSPEQLSGQKIDGRSDLYSLAVSLYQLLCGRLPFVGDSMAQLMFKIANEPAPDIRQIRPDLPTCIADILLKGMDKNVNNRYQTGEAFAQALTLCRERIVALGGDDNKNVDIKL